MKSVVVYCGSNPGHNPLYGEKARELGISVAKRGIKLIYGGGHRGLMGMVADGAMESAGAVTGIIPDFLGKLEVAHKNLTELHVVETMHQRKAKMVSMSDGVIALPGGYGTFDELFEILTWAQLSLYEGPVGLLNINGFYDLLLAQLDKMVEEGFLKTENRALLLVSDNCTTLLNAMEDFIKNRPENKSLDQSLYVDTKNDLRTP